MPRGLARQLALIEIAAEDAGGESPGPPPTRDLWLVVRRAKQRLPKIRAVIRWLRATLTAAGGAVALGGLRRSS